MTPQSQRQARSVLRLVFYALVVLMLIVGFLYAYELLGGPIDAFIEVLGDLIGLF